jgi:hypothetical protein
MQFRQGVPHACFWAFSTGSLGGCVAEMKGIRILVPVLSLTAYCYAAYAEDLEDLSRQRYAVTIETRVDGDFEGCDSDKVIPFTNGLVFVCRHYSYSYSYRPEVLILQHIKDGDIKVLINGREYRGKVYRR